MLISKVVHTERFPREDDNDWNNDRNDLRHLTQFASKNLFNGLPLAWQTFDMLRAAAGQPKGGKLPLDALNRKAGEVEEMRRRLGIQGISPAARQRLEKSLKVAEDDMEPALLDILSDMLQSPIMYINGHKSLEGRLQAIERELLRKYVDNGGFVFVEACCGKPDFDEGFKTLAAKLWPDRQAGRARHRPSGLEKQIRGQARRSVQAHGDRDGLQDGADLFASRTCRASGKAIKPNSGRADRAFKLGANIIAYATGLEPPQPRLTQVELPGGRDASNIPRGFLKVGQIKYSGDWQPAPRAMHNLMSYMHKNLGLDVALKTEELDLKPDSKAVIDYKFVYMHGRTEFNFDPAQLKNLRFNLENGGLLFADACCGKLAFDKSFRKFAAELFPSRKLEPVPLDDVLFSKELNGVKLDESLIKCRRKAAGANESGLMRNMPPDARGDQDRQPLGRPVQQVRHRLRPGTAPLLGLPGL